MRVAFTYKELHLAVGSYSSMLGLMTGFNNSNIFTLKQDKWLLGGKFAGECRPTHADASAATSAKNGGVVVLERSL